MTPGADPTQIKLAFEGPSSIRVAESGDLILTTALGEMRMQKPIVYQLETDEHKTLIAGNYMAEQNAVNLLSARSAPSTQTSASSSRQDRGLSLSKAVEPHSALPQVGFQLASYDRSKPVVIDPVLLYSTYLGGSISGDLGFGIAVDGVGQAYVTGYTGSADFPTANPFQATHASGLFDAFVTKLNAAGIALLYSTYLGGSSGEHGGGSERGGIAVDGADSAYVTGFTHSTNFPTANPFQATIGGGSGGQDAFVTKLVEKPVAHVGSDQSVAEGTLVTLDGSGSTATNPTYSWTQVAGPSVSLANSGSAQPTFTAPLCPRPERR